MKLQRVRHDLVTEYARAHTHTHTHTHTHKHGDFNQDASRTIIFFLKVESVPHYYFLLYHWKHSTLFANIANIAHNSAAIYQVKIRRHFFSTRVKFHILGKKLCPGFSNSSQITTTLMKLLPENSVAVLFFNYNLRSYCRLVLMTSNEKTITTF